MWDMIVSVPDHCLSFYFSELCDQVRLNPACSDTKSQGMVNRIYPPELQLNKANTSDTEAPFLDLHLSISNGFHFI